MPDPHYDNLGDNGNPVEDDENLTPSDNIPEVTIDSSDRKPNVSSAGLWCRGLTYTVSHKQILTNITFTAMPGELTMVMGPSGAGKTTLLNCLLNRVRTGGVGGERGLNAEFASKDLLKTYAHYVMQYDVILAYLTVKETLDFSANLRMPGSTQRERQEAVARVMDWMELRDCQNTYCGGNWRKGISTGQIKRLAIAQELLGDPPILVLDEPTTGLDSCLALELVATLRRVARETSKTVIASVHQPSQRAFDLFDKLVLLSDGGILYSGPAQKAIEYFASVGKQCPPGFSPPDYLLELATDESFKTSSARRLQSERAGSNSPTGDRASATEDQSYSDPVGKALDLMTAPNYSTADELELMRKHFMQSEEHNEIIRRIEDLEKLPLPPRKSRKEEDNSWRFQFRTLWKRSTLNTLRNPLTSYIILIVNIVQALLLGALFFQLQSDVDKSTHPYTQIRDYAFWESAPVQFLAYGLDRNGTDPLLDMIYNGVNSATGANLLFDVAVNPKLLPYLGDMAACTRTLYEDLFFNASGVEYPRWYWPEGSIDGNPQTTTETPQSTTTSSAVDTETGPVSPGQVSPAFASMSLETFSNTVMALMQLLDYWATDKRPLGRMDFPDTEGAELMPFWMLAFFKVDPYVSPLLCCMGLGFTATMTDSALLKCSQRYPGYSFPVLPGYQDSTVRAVAEWLNEPETRRNLQMSVSSVSSAAKKTLNDIKEEQSRRKILNPAAQKKLVIRKLAGAAAKSVGPNLVSSIRSNSLAGLPSGTKLARAPRRKLGSGLGGLVTDIWDRLFSDEDSPLYALTENLIRWFDKFEACDNSYCTAIVDTYNTLKDELANLANSFLSVLNMAGAVFFCCVNLGFSSYDVLLQFPKNRAVFNRERSNGLYRTSSYFFAKMISDLPFQLVPCIFWTIIFYFMVGFASTAKQFFQFMGICLLTSFTAYSFGYTISALSARLEVAVVVAPLILVVMMVFSGFFMRDEATPVAIGWLKYFSIFRWGFFALNTVQFPPGGEFGSMDNDLSLAIIGVTIPTMWISCLALLALAAVFRIAGYIALRWCNRSVGMET